MIDLRDQTCRTPWCDAPIRHHDHAQDWADGGPTTAGNGQGLCEACNHAKQAPGWHATAIEQGPAPPMETTSPSRHRHTSRPPEVSTRSLTCAPRPPNPERMLLDIIWKQRNYTWVG